MEQWKITLLSFLAFNVALFSWIYYTNQDSRPWLICLHLLVPIVVWEVLLAATFIPEEWINLADLIGEHDTVTTAHSFRRIRSGGDYSQSAIQPGFWR